MKHSVQFSLAASTGELRPVRCRVSWGGRRVDLRLGHSVSPERWRNGRASGPGAQEVNRAAAELAARIEDYFSRCSAEGREPSPDEIRALGGHSPRLGGERRVTTLLARFAKECGQDSGWSLSTYKKFRTLGAHITDYDRLADIGEVTTEWMRGLCLHLEREAGMRNSTIIKTVKLLRWFLNWAEREGLYTQGAHHSFKPRLRTTDASADIVYLEWEEFLDVWNVELPSGPLQRARDVFCFQCLTGLRYSDTRALTRDDIVNGKVRVVMRKTGGTVEIELNRRAVELLHRWEGLPNNRALPVVSNNKYNRYVHELCRLAGLDRPHTRVWYEGGRRLEETVPLWKAVSSHAGRRTFVVRALSLGIPAEVIMRWTGHSDYDAMKPYMKIVDQVKSEAMRRFDLDWAPEKAPENG